MTSRVESGLIKKCKHCGKTRGEHNATNNACPMGKKTRIGYIGYHPTNTFEEK